MAINDIIKNLDLMRIKAPSGLTYAQELMNAANLLSECIQNRINRGSLSNSISTADIADIQISGNRLTVTLKIQNAIRPSIFQKWNGSSANVFWLLNDGYKVKKNVWFKNIKNFGYRSAERFVEQGINDFNSQNKLGVSIEVQRPLMYYG